MSELLGLRGRFAAALVAVSALTLAVTALLVLVPLDRKLEQDALDVARADDARRPADVRAPRPRAAAGGVAAAPARDHQPAAPDRRRGVRVRRRRAHARRDGPRRTRSLPGGTAALREDRLDLAAGPGSGRIGGAGRRPVQGRRRPRRARPAALDRQPRRGPGRGPALARGRRVRRARGGARGRHRARDAARAAPERAAHHRARGGRARPGRHAAGRGRPPRRGRRPRPRVRDDAAAAGGAGAVAAHVRQHRLARAAHAADLARPDAARRYRGARP